MISNSETNPLHSSPNGPTQPTGDLSVDQYLEQLHADFDPVYSMLMDYQCAVMEVET